MICATPYNTLYSPIPGQGTRRTQSDMSNQSRIPGFPRKSRTGTCCIHGTGCAAGQAKELSEKLHGLNVGENVTSKASHRSKKRPKKKEKAKHRRNDSCSREKETNEQNEKRHERTEKKQPQYENISLVKDCSREDKRDLFHGPLSESFPKPEAVRRRKRLPDSEITSILPSNEMCTTEMQDTSRSNSRSKTRYIGTRTYKEAEVSLTKKTNFVLYHRFPHETTLMGLLPELKMYVCYRTSTGSYRHYRIRQKSVPRPEGLYYIDYGEENSPSFPSLTQLVKYYTTYGTVRRMGGGETSAEIFPC